MVLKRKLPSRVAQETPAPAAMPPAAPSTQAVSLPEDTAPVFAQEAPLTFADTPAEKALAVSPQALEPSAETSQNKPVTSNPVTSSPPEEASEELVVSTPSENSLRRKMRPKTARSFSTTLPEAPKAATPTPSSAASVIPQTNVDFDKVAGRLAGLGVMEESKDTLTASAAPQAAEMASFPSLPSMPTEAPQETTPSVAAPLPELVSTGKKQPDWLAELTKELNAAMPKENERDPKRDALGLPPPPTLPPNLLSGLIADEGPGVASAEPTPVPKIEPVLPTPTMHGTSQSDVPWAAPASPKDDWSLDAPASNEATSLPPGPSQPMDIYAGVGKEAPAGAPPWQVKGTQPAELPGGRTNFNPAMAATNGMSMGKLITTGAVLLLVAGGAYWLVARGDKTQEQLARLTGSLRETTERLPTDPNGPNRGGNGTFVQPEQTIAGNNTNLLPPPDGTAATPSTSSVIDFADVPPDQANKTIAAKGNEPMPEDISFIAKFQKAVAEKKAERMETPAPDGTTLASTGNPALDKTIRNNALKSQLDAELAAYRKALVDASSVAEAPRPGEFLGHAEQPPAKPYMNGAETVSTTDGPLLPPPSQQASKDALPAAAAYGNNPSNLPILPEPTTEAPKVRTLADFDVSMFEPKDDEKVRIPKGIRPRMSTSDFPEMDVLSLVPNKGLIAYKNGAEGVLLIGETVDGWQLVQVGPDSAEFKNGGRSYYVSSDQ